MLFVDVLYFLKDDVTRQSKLVNPFSCFVDCVYLGSNFVLSSLSQLFLLSTACLSSLVSSSFSFRLLVVLCLSRVPRRLTHTTHDYREMNIPREKRDLISLGLRTCTF